MKVITLLVSLFITISIHAQNDIDVLLIKMENRLNNKIDNLDNKITNSKIELNNSINKSEMILTDLIDDNNTIINRIDNKTFNNKDSLHENILAINNKVFNSEDSLQNKISKIYWYYENLYYFIGCIGTILMIIISSFGIPKLYYFITDLYNKNSHLKNY